MALPVTISDAAWPPGNGNLGPWISGGNVYIAYLDGTDNTILRVAKATDPTSSFTEQDVSNSPDITGSAPFVDAVQDGTDLHFVLVEDQLAYYAKFSMSSDTWQDVDPGTPTNTEYNFATATNNPELEWGSIAVRSDGDVVIVYVDSPTRDKGQNVDSVYLARLEGGSWTTGVVIADTASKGNRRGYAYIVMGGSDQAHIAYIAEEDGDFHTRAYSSANAARTERTSAQAFAWDTDGINRGHKFTRSSTTRIGWQVSEANASAADNIRFIYYDDFSDDSTPTYTVETAESNAYGAGAVNQAGLHFDDNETNDEQYLGFIDQTTRDIHLRSNAGGTTWSDENSGSAISGAITATGLSGNVFLRSGNYLYAFLYNDSGTIQYDEFTLYAASSTQDLTPSLFDDSTDTFPAPQVDMNVGPNTLLDDSTDTFYAPTVAATYNLAVGLFDDSSDTFPAPTVTPGVVDISPDALFDDSADTFPAPTVASVYALTVGLFDDSSDTFPAPTVTYTYSLTPGLFDDSSDTFPAATVTPGAVDLTPSLFDDSTDTFYAPSIAFLLSASLFDDSTDTFYAVTVTATYDIAPSLFDDSSDTFPAATVSSIYALTVGLFDDSTDTFQAVTVAATYDLTPGLFDDSSDTFPAVTVTSVYALTVGLFDDSADTFPAPTVTATYDLAPSFLDDSSDTFFGPTVAQASGAQDVSPDAVFANDNTFFAPNVVALAAAGGTTLNRRASRKRFGGGGAAISWERFEQIMAELEAKDQALADRAVKVKSQPKKKKIEETAAKVVAATVLATPAVNPELERLRKTVALAAGAKRVDTLMSRLAAIDRAAQALQDAITDEEEVEMLLLVA